ncbi:MAG TPA: hypothetical protein VJV05_11355 [Pyrinomonadaceae bacterium]|nr:hypothetical protein [Pyrinomonadaceae bacterium]
MKQSSQFVRVAVLLLLPILLGDIVTAQTTRKPAPVKAGWSGVITFRKTLEANFSSDDRIAGRVNEQDRIKHVKTRRYVYRSSIIVNDSAGTGRPATIARVGLTDSETTKSIQTETTNCHSWEPDRVIKAESTDRKVTIGSGNGAADSFSLSVNAMQFRLSFSLPAIQGRYRHETNATYSNLCPDSTRKPSTSSNTNDVRIERGGTEIEGEIDPKNPDVIEGTKTWNDGAKNGFTYSVTWRLRRKPQPLMITDVRFSEPVYPSPNEWRDIDEGGRSVDGNQVKVIATIANFGSTDKTATVSFKELIENSTLPNGPVSAVVPANGQKEVELVWDTSGFSWYQSGADVNSAMDRKIEVSIPDDSMQKEIKIIPKPVVVVWGFWQSKESVERFFDYFKVINPKWNVWASHNDIRKVSTDNADTVDKDVREIQKDTNAWHVDLVAFTNGGLVARVYVNSKMPTQFDGKPTATHLIMLGVPNLGTPCAVGLYGLSFKINTQNLDAVAELSPDAMKRFNLLVNNTNGTRFATLGIDSRTSTCQDDAHGDGFSPFASAIWRAKVNYLSRANVSSRNILGEVSHFRQLYKWLAIPPKGDHTPDPDTLAGNFSDEYLKDPTESRIGARNYGAMFGGPLADDVEVKPGFAKVVRIDARGTVDLELPVTTGSRLAMNLLASPGVSATLLNPSGQVVGSNLAGSPESGEVFRTIKIAGPVASGKWRVRLESRETAATEVALTVFF